MIEYYLDKDKQELNPKWVNEEAEKTAKSFEGTNFSYTQLRRFYGVVKALERQLLDAQDKKGTFARILPMVKLLKAKSEYTLKRGVVPKSFKDWLWENVDSVNEKEDFKAFLLSFEAVVGFSAKYLKN